MSTRCEIGIQELGSQIRYIYCHHDGYPEHMGAMLYRHYNSREKAEKLIDLGRLSSVEEKIGKKHDMHDWRNNRGVCNAYHRDGEMSWEEATPSTVQTAKAYWDDQLRDYIEWRYLYTNKKWMYVRNVHWLNTGIKEEHCLNSNNIEPLSRYFRFGIWYEGQNKQNEEGLSWDEARDIAIAEYMEGRDVSYTEYGGTPTSMGYRDIQPYPVLISLLKITKEEKEEFTRGWLEVGMKENDKRSRPWEDDFADIRINGSHAMSHYMMGREYAKKTKAKDNGREYYLVKERY